MKYKENSEAAIETAEENPKSPDTNLKETLVERISLDVKIIEKCFENIKNTLECLSDLNENND